MKKIKRREKRKISKTENELYILNSKISKEMIKRVAAHFVDVDKSTVSGRFIFIKELPRTSLLSGYKT